MNQILRQSSRGLLAAMAVAIAGVVVPPVASAAELAGADALYWSNSDASVVSSAKLDGSGGSDLAFTGTTVSSPSGTAMDAVAGVIYWANSGNGTISWARLNGPGGTLNTTNATVEQPRGLAIDPVTAKRIYWANSGGGSGGTGSISWAALSGAGGGDLPIPASDVDSPAGVVVSPADGTVYWANSAGSGPGPGSGSIMTAKADGSDAAPVPISGATVDAPSSVALDPGTQTVYWTNSPAGTAGSIAYWHLDTASGGDLSTTAPVDHPQGIAIDPVAGRLYWANSGSNTIAYANLDGSAGGTLATGTATVSKPMFPVLLVAPDGTGAPRITGATSPGSTLTCQKAGWGGDVLSAFYYRAPRNISWQWSRGGTDIAGATTTTYIPTTVGSYVCREMAKNHAGTTTQSSVPFVVSERPVATGAGASSVTATSAVLGGMIVPEYAATTYHFDFGLTASYGSRRPATDATVGSDGVSHTIAQTITGLTPNRLYHFRLVATNANGTSYGSDQTFTTSARPAVSTSGATSLSTFGAVLNGSVNPENLATGYYFEIGPTTAYGGRLPVSNASVGSDDAGHAVAQAVSGLRPNTTYHFRLVAVNATGTSYGADATFTTLAQSAPLLTVPGRVGTLGASLKLTVSCAGVAGQHCQASVAARTIEKLSADGKRINGVSTAPVRARSRTVIVAGAKLGLAAGSRRDVTLRLNATGQMLRSRFKKLPATTEVTTTVSGRTQTIRRAKVTFGPEPPRIRISQPLSTKGPALSIRLSCSGTTGQRCAGVLALTTFWRLGTDGRTTIGLTRAPVGAGELVTIGRAGFTVKARGTSRRTVRLNALGRTLLSRFGRIPGTLTVTVTQNGWSTTVSRTAVSLRR